MRVRVGKIGTVATSLSLVISLAACGGADGAKTGDSGMAASAGVEPAVVTIVAKDFAY